ncbi:winged helix DNA-binding domain-containing protein [Clavulina sp. PMI_390]|nr:winged helix DNA-binding domain-containing protein [Clavulina sp. PMI_390]
MYDQIRTNWKCRTSLLNERFREMSHHAMKITRIIRDDWARRKPVRHAARDSIVSVFTVAVPTSCLVLNMNRRPGLAGFDLHNQSLQSYAALGETLNQNQVDALHSQLSQFRSALVRFASEHRRDIVRDPSFRHAFQQMCASIGVDPLAGPRKGGWWSEVLGLGDWQHELGVQIVDICVNTRERNGGIIEMTELIRLLSKLRGVDGDSSKAGKITEDDVVRSIKTLEPLGAGYRVIKVGSKSMVCSSVKELDSDQAVILSLAQKTGGRFDEKTLVIHTRWTVERARAAASNMIDRDGLCWVDEQDESGGISYWVPSAIAWDDE